MTKIEPTIGRRVWFWTGNADQVQPYDAGIAYVWSSTMINISYADKNGVMWSRTSVPLWDGESSKPAGAYCEWMGYQKAQAARHEGATSEAHTHGEAYNGNFAAPSTEPPVSGAVGNAPGSDPLGR